MKLITPIRKAVGMSRRSHGQAPDAAIGSYVHHPGVPFIAQNHVNLCGDACVSMILKFYNKEATSGLTASKKHPSAMKMARNPRGIFSGSDSSQWVEALTGAGLHSYIFYGRGAQFSSRQIAVVLLDFGPFVAGVKFNRFTEHAILIIGVQNDRLFFHDPWRGANMSMTLAQFNSICKASQSGNFVTAATNPVTVEDLVDDEIYAAAA
jgi:hypothetical protein